MRLSKNAKIVKDYLSTRNGFGAGCDTKCKNFTRKFLGDELYNVLNKQHKKVERELILSRPLIDGKRFGCYARPAIFNKMAIINGWQLLYKGYCVDYAGCGIEVSTNYLFSITDDICLYLRKASYQDEITYLIEFINTPVPKDWGIHGWSLNHQYDIDFCVHF